MNIKHIAVISIVGMLLTTLGCNNNSTEMKQQKAKADRGQNPTMTSR